MGAQNTNCTMKFIDIPEDRQREAIFDLLEYRLDIWS